MVWVFNFSLFYGTSAYEAKASVFEDKASRGMGSASACEDGASVGIDLISVYED
jgi:hypothetical protein